MTTLFILSLVFIVYILFSNNKGLNKKIESLNAQISIISKEHSETDFDNRILRSNFEALAQENKELKANLEAETLRNDTVISQKKSSETRNGQMVEQIAPLLEEFKYDPRNARFLGTPIDFIVFDTYSADPSIVFLEVKTNDAKLSTNQKLIKNLILSGKVRWEELRVSYKGKYSKLTKSDNEENTQEENDAN